MTGRTLSFPSIRNVMIGLLAIVLGLGALTVPWLTVKSSGGSGVETVEAAVDPSDLRNGRDRAGSSAGRPTLLVTALPVPPRPRLASSAPSFATPAPDAGSVLTLKQRLRGLSYMVGPDDGTLDPATRFGITAFQKVENLPRTGEPDAATLSRLDTAQPPAAAYSTPPDHLEVDIARQVVFVVRGGRVTETLPTSTGNGKVFRSQGRRSRAVTPNGQFAITYKRNGWRRSPLGLLYRPAYFNGGIAFHGAKSVPTSPASHGCVRLPMPFADWFADNVSAPGTVVYVYGNPGEPNPAPVAGGPPPQPAGAPPPETGPPPPPDPAQGPPPGEPPPPQGASPFLGGILGGS